MPEESRFIGFTALRADACFHACGVKSLSDRSPGQFAQDHSLVLGLLFRVPSLSLPPSPFRARALLPGFLPSSRHHWRRVHSTRGFPSPRYVPSAGAHNLSTAFSALLLLGLFHPRAVSRASARSGDCHLRAAVAPLRSDLPPCRCDHLPLARTNPDGHGWRPRLRGLVPRRSSRTPRLVVNHPRGRTPLRVISPPGPHLPPWPRLTRDLRS